MAKRKPKRGSSGATRRPPADDFDSPWKEALDHYFERCMAFFFPGAHADIDWSRGYEMLDKELQPIIRRSAHGRRYVDKLVKVWLRDGHERWILIHVEVQAAREGEFPRRMHVYNHRIFDRYCREVISLAILADDDPRWRPTRYEYARWGFRSLTEFPIVKLIDYATRYQELETHPNPFALVVLAQLKGAETRRSPEDRRAWKVRLVKGLYERGMSPEDVRRLFEFIDWVMELPEGLDDRFWVELDAYEQEKSMRFINVAERTGMAKGLHQGIEVVLEMKFGAEGLEYMSELRDLDIRDHVLLGKVLDRLKTAEDLDGVRRYVKRLLRTKAAKAAESE